MFQDCIKIFEVRKARANNIPIFAPCRQFVSMTLTLGFLKYQLNRKNQSMELKKLLPNHVR